MTDNQTRSITGAVTAIASTIAGAVVLSILILYWQPIDLAGLIIGVLRATAITLLVAALAALVIAMAIVAVRSAMRHHSRPAPSTTLATRPQPVIIIVRSESEAEATITALMTRQNGIEVRR